MRPGSTTRFGLASFATVRLGGPSGDEAGAARSALAWAKQQATTYENKLYGSVFNWNIGAKQANVEVARRWKSAYWSRFYQRWRNELVAAARAYRHPGASADEIANSTWWIGPGEEILKIEEGGSVEKRFEHLDQRAAAVAAGNAELTSAISTWNQIWYSDSGVQDIDRKAGGSVPTIELSNEFKEAWPQIQNWVMWGGVAAGSIIALMVINFTFGKN